MEQENNVNHNFKNKFNHLTKTSIPYSSISSHIYVEFPY
jgi:hypothetical protein